MKKNPFNSVRGRLTIWYGIIMAVVFLLFDVVLYRGFKMSQMTTIDETLLTAAEEAEKAIRRAPPEKWMDILKNIERAFVVNRLFIQVVKVPNSKRQEIEPVARSGVLEVNISQKEIFALLAYKPPQEPRYFNLNEKIPLAHPFRLILYPSPIDKRSRYVIQVGISLKKLFHTLENYRTTQMTLGPPLLLISVLGGYLILNRALKPVRSVVLAAQKITTEDLSHRLIPPRRKDEIGELVNTFNQMLSRLENSVLQIKQFSSDASHDLKTPLTVIRGEIDITLRKKRSDSEYIATLSSIHEEVGKMEQVIDNLLFLSRIDLRNYFDVLAGVNLDEILLEVFEHVQTLALHKGVNLTLRRVDPSEIQGEPVLLGRMIMNLLDNAVKYTPQGGMAELALENDGQHIVLTIRDTGIGIPPEAMPHIFDRFYRVDPSRSRHSEGSGLGLAIVKKITELHRADIVVDSVPNMGTTITVTFSSPHPDG